MTKFQYKARTLDSVRKRSEQKSVNFDKPYIDGIKVYKVKEGENTIRILPATWSTADHFGMDVWFHSNIGEDQQTYICPTKMGSGPCPVCNEVKSIKPGNPADDEIINRLKPYRRVAIWVIDRESPEEGPLLYPMPWTVDRDVNMASIDGESGEILQIDHPDEGFDVYFTKSGTGIKTKYGGIRVARRSTPISANAKEADTWLKYIVDNQIPKILKIYSFEAMTAAFTGQAAKREELPQEEKEAPFQPKEEPSAPPEEEPDAPAVSSKLSASLSKYRTARG